MIAEIIFGLTVLVSGGMGTYPPECPGGAVERTWNKQASQGRILALARAIFSTNPFKLSPPRSTASSQYNIIKPAENHVLTYSLYQPRVLLLGCDISRIQTSLQSTLGKLPLVISSLSYYFISEKVLLKRFLLKEVNYTNTLLLLP